MYKIAIVGASTLLGRELKEALEESPLAVADLVLFDSPELHGKLDQVGDEIAIIQAIGPDAFERVDFTFFCATEELTRQHWQQALQAGSSVLDLTGALDQEPDVVVRAPWVGSGFGSEGAAIDLLTPAVVPAHPAALALSLVLEQLQQIAPLRFAAVTLLQPASEAGRAAMDELHQQTVNLLSFQGLPREVFDAQVAYNLLSGLGEEAKISLAAVEARVRRHTIALAERRWPEVALQAVQAPVFHGHTFSIFVELERPVEISVLESSFGTDHVELILEETDSPSNLAATGQSSVLLRLRPELAGASHKTQTSRLWLWAASDNLRLHARNAVECALELRRLRPQGTVQ